MSNQLYYIVYLALDMIIFVAGTIVGGLHFNYQQSVNYMYKLYIKPHDSLIVVFCAFANSAIFLPFCLTVIQNFM